MILLNGDARAEIMNKIAFFLVHKTVKITASRNLEYVRCRTLTRCNQKS